MRRAYLGLAALAVLSWTFLLLFMGRRELRQEEERLLGIALSQARTMFHQIVDVRTWNASHGGVYVEITPETPPNPYLNLPNRDVTTTTGKHLTLLNPAYMTRQLAEIAHEKHGVQIHLTSLKPLRPGNAPDPWEREALEAFERGEREQTDLSTGRGGETVFRYMAPLGVEEPCLECHDTQGYSVGQVRGGLSITYPSEVLSRTREAFRGKVFLAGLLLWLLGVGLVAAVTAAWRRETLIESHLRELTLEDDLTGLHNRRGFLMLAEKELRIARRTGHKELLLFMDLDTMKEINDLHGHPAGDAALRKTAEALRASFRSSDILARHGGDEFVALCPDTGAAAAGAIIGAVEKNLAAVSAGESAPWRLSVSIGMAEFDPARPVPLERLINEADARMYEQKMKKKGP